MQNKFYITTPIYYVNDEPHVGTAYTTILADVINRYYKIFGYETYFLTGTDEHGLKVQQAADKRKVSTEQHVNEYVKRFHNTWKFLNIKYSDFIRTTEKRHTECVQSILNMLWEKGDIYLDEYEGLYSVSEERFITKKEAEEGSFREVIKIKEKNYFFKMSKYQNNLINHIEDNPNFIYPESRKNEILGFLKKNLNDLCISRPKKRLQWGIEIPFDKDYVTYVWFDALINYISAIAWNKDKKKFNKWWPVNYHLMGKDIITTHAVYWPTMLMACEIPLPKTIFAHGWWMLEKEKMSKSLGNVVNPLDFAKQYGSDALRYYLMRNMVLGQDAKFSSKSFIERYNADLANDYGNLINRVLILIDKNFNSFIPKPGDFNEIDLNLIALIKKTPTTIREEINNLKIHETIEKTFELIRYINKYLEMNEPWKQVKINNKQGSPAATCLFLAAEAIRVSSELLLPIIPEKAMLVLKSIGQEKETGDIVFKKLNHGNKISNPGTIFPRIDVKND